MLFKEETIRAAADTKQTGYLGSISLSFKASGKDDHIHFDMVWLVVEGFIPFHRQFSILLGDVFDPPVVEMDAFGAGAVVKLFVVFTEGTHIAVDFMYLGIHVIMDQLCQLERVHAAGS